MTKTKATGCIQQRGENLYRIFLNAGVDERGKRIRKTMTVRGSYHDAKRTLVQLEQDLKEHGLSTSMRLVDWIAHWLKSAERTKAAQTVAEYRRMLTTRVIPALGRYRLDQLESSHCTKFLQQLACSPHPHREGTISGQTRLKYHRLLSVLLQDAVYQGVLTINPMKRVRAPKAEQHEARFYDQQTVARFWAALQHEPYLTQIVLATSLLLGVRRGELIGLRWEDINWHANIVSIRRSAYKVNGSDQDVKTPKTAGSQHDIRLPTPLRDLLLQWQGIQGTLATGYICADEAGNWLLVDTATKLMTTFVRRHRLPELTLHGLRHTSATLMLEAGVSMQAVSAHLGHGQTTTTANIYAHTSHEARALAGSAIEDVVTSHEIV